ncbi:ATP-binding protein [Streptomyces sp. NPDC002851]
MTALLDAVPLSLGVAAVVAGPVLLYTRRTLVKLRGERDAAVHERHRYAAQRLLLEEELGHFASARLPAALEGQSDGSEVPLRHRELGSTDFAARLQAVLKQSATAVGHERAAADAARAAFLVMADRIQVMALAQQQGLDELERRVEDPHLMAGLMRADHAAAQLARQAQTMAVLCGAWPGRQWPSAISMVDVVRGAQSRILEYQRVQVQGPQDLSIQAPMVEALIHAVAELLDNATRFSPPTVSVLVAIRPVHRGAVIEIDDGGVGMTEQALTEAEVRLRGELGVHGRGLGGSPHLGLAAVGRLARRFGFSVKLESPSAYGGVRAVVLVPSAQLAEVPQTPATPAPPSTTVQAAPTASVPQAADMSVGGLPQRRSRRHQPLSPITAPTSTRASGTSRSPEEAGAFMSSLQAGTRQGRARAAGSGPDHEEGERR